MTGKYTLQVFAKGLNDWVDFYFDDLAAAKAAGRNLLYKGEKSENLKLINHKNKTLKIRGDYWRDAQ
tara:strand:- start:735 stop:935 length:201 start_codon:yes stop_codon:yes gene_type:complete